MRQVGKRTAILLELNVIPLVPGRSINADIAGLAKVIEASYLGYRLTATEPL